MVLRSRWLSVWICLLDCLIVNNIGLLAQGVFSIWTVVAILVIIGMIYLLVRPYKESQTLKVGKTSVAASK